MAVAIIALIQCLPRLLDLILRLGTWMAENKVDNWINDLEAAVDKLEKAQTPKEKIGAARGIVDSIRHLK